MLYCCETCGKKFTTEEEALNCERTHAEEKAKKEERAVWVGTRPTVFDDKRKKNDKKELKKILDKVMY